jgi:chemotaxis response regulator CheB
MYCSNEETSTVYGMPRMIVENGLADEVLPLTLIPSRIVKLVQTPFNRYVTSKDNG